MRADWLWNASQKLVVSALVINWAMINRRQGVLFYQRVIDKFMALMTPEW